MRYLRIPVLQQRQCRDLTFLTSPTYINEKADVGLIIKGVVHDIARREMRDYMIGDKTNTVCASERFGRE